MELHTHPYATQDSLEQHGSLQDGQAAADVRGSSAQAVTPDISEMQLANFGDYFRAFSLRGGSGGLDPFLGVDHVWMSAPTFPPHPHQRIGVLSYLFSDSETGMANHDSIGNRNTIRPGGLHWTSTGRGIVHEEFPAEEGKAVHSLQVFVRLAPEQRSAAPSSFMLEPESIPTLERPGVSIRVPFGRLEEVAPPATPTTAFGMFDVKLDAGAEVSIPIDANSMAFVLPISGSISVNGKHFERGDLSVPVFLPRSDSGLVTLRADQGKVWAVFFSGIPLGDGGHEG